LRDPEAGVTCRGARPVGERKRRVRVHACRPWTSRQASLRALRDLRGQRSAGAQPPWPAVRTESRRIPGKTRNENAIAVGGGQCALCKDVLLLRCSRDLPDAVPSHPGRMRDPGERELLSRSTDARLLQGFSPDK
jgi:hypothetical protein